MEETKVCNSCGKEFPLTHEYFNYANKAKGQFQGMCRECRKIYRKSLLENPEAKERERESRRKYYFAHKEQEKERSRIKNGRRYWGDEEFSKRTGWQPNETGVSESGRHLKSYNICNAETYREKSRKYLEANPQKCRENHRRYLENNKDSVAKYAAEYHKRKYHSDSLYKFQCHIRNTINQSFRRYETYKPRTNKEVIGITSSELRDYLLRTFEETYGYAWDQAEPVHIDHIIPLATAKTEEDIVRLCHYTNLRLLKAHDNLIKGASQNYKIGDN